MGLVPGFVFSVNRRAALAALAIGVSVSYALVAGAAVGGLSEAQDALASGLEETTLVAVDEEGEAFDPMSLDPNPDGALATARAENHTVYTTRAGDPVVTNTSRAGVGPNSPLAPGENVTIAGENRTVFQVEPPDGASRGWIALAEPVFEAAGGVEAPMAHVVAYEDADPALAERLSEQGLTVREAPGAFPFYTAGASELVSAVQVTVVASALVVALLASTVVSMELRAKRSSFATLQVYAGSGLVRRLVAGRGVAILAAGHAVGIGVTLASLALLGRAGVAEFTLPTDYLVTALSATVLGGLAGLAVPVRRAGQPLTAGELGEAEDPLDLPRPLRLTLTSWRTLVPLAIAAAILAGSLGVIYGAVDMPEQVFGAGDDQVIVDTSNNPLRGTAPAFLGTHMGAVDGFDGSSPEIYAPTAVEGRPVMVRGVHWDSLQSMSSVELVEGTPPTAPGEAVLGERAAKRLDADVGDRLLVPAAYASSLERLHVTGTASAAGLLEDEVLVNLATARQLTDVAPGEVNLVRYRLDPNLPADAPEPALPSGLEATSLDVTPEEPIPLQQAQVTLRLVNFDQAPRERQLTLEVNNEPVADRWVEVPGRTITNTTMSFRVPQTGSLDLSVNPERTVETGEGAYLIEAPDVVTTDSTVDVTVTTREDGDPAEGVDVTFDNATATTDADGEASLPAGQRGNRTILAEGPEGAGATSIVVVAPEDLHRSRILFETISGPREVSSGSWPGAANVHNVGGELFEDTLQVPVNGTPVNATELRLMPGDRARVTFTLDLDPGTHRVGPPSTSMLVTVGGSAADDDGGDGGDGNGTDGDGGDGDGGDGTDGGTDGGDGSDGDQAGDSNIRELLERRAEAERAGSPEDEDVEPLEAFLGETFENFNAAVTVVTIATVLHAGLIGIVAVRRDVEENADTVGTLASVGADRTRLRAHALKEFALVGGVATVIGTVVGLGAVGLAASQGVIGGFGHALVPRTGLGFALRVAAVSLAVTLAAAVFAVERVRGDDMQQLLSQGPVKSTRPPLDELIGGTQR